MPIFKNLTVVYADLCRYYGMVSNKWYNEAKPILDYIVCPIGINSYSTCLEDYVELFIAKPSQLQE